MILLHLLIITIYLHNHYLKSIDCVDIVEFIYLDGQSTINYMTHVRLYKLQK